jgi:hypothetical protein
MTLPSPQALISTPFRRKKNTTSSSQTRALAVFALAAVALLLCSYVLWQHSDRAHALLSTLTTFSSTACNAKLATYYPQMEGSLARVPVSALRPGFRLAFLGDSNVNADARRVLELVRDKHPGRSAEHVLRAACCAYKGLSSQLGGFRRVSRSR